MQYLLSQQKNLEDLKFYLKYLFLKEKLSNGYDLATLASDVRIYAEGLSNKIKEARS